MKSVDIILNGKNYKVKAGDIFQAKLGNPIVHQIYVIQSKQGDGVYLEVVEKLSSTLGLMRVNTIKWFEGGNIKEENFKDVIVGPTNQEGNKPLDRMTKKQLVEFAEKNNIKINSKSKKAEILKTIKESV